MQIAELLEELEITDIKAIDDEGYSALHLTVEHETFSQKKIIETLGFLLDQGVDPDLQNRFDETVLRLAVVKKLTDVIDFLIKRNINKDSVIPFWINREYTKFQRMLAQKSNLDNFDCEMQAMETESASFLEWLILKGFDCYRENAFHIAIEYNLQHILPVLFKYSEHVNFADQENRTLLHFFLKNITPSHILRRLEMKLLNDWYAERFVADIVKTLLDKGISADSPDNICYGLTPIQLAISMKANMPIVEILLERCTNLHRKNFNNETLLQTVLLNSLSQEWSEEYSRKILDYILAKGGDVSELNETNGYGHDNKYSPLGYAVEKRNVRIIDFLIKNGANVLVTTKDGETLLHLLAKRTGRYREETELLNLFIKKGCPINAKDKNGNTPLHIAICHSNMRMIKQFIEHSVDVNCKTLDGKTPLHIAAIDMYNVEITMLLLDHGADFHTITEDGESMLHLLVKVTEDIEHSIYYEKAIIDLVKLFVNVGCHINAKDKNGISLIHLAAMHATDNVVQMLIQLGADMNCRNNERETPLHFALKNHDPFQVVEILLQLGANVHAKDLTGQTALHKISLESPSADYCLHSLLDYGADISTQDFEKLTAFSYAYTDDTQYLKKRRNRRKRRNHRVLEYNMAGYLTKKLSVHHIKLETVNLPTDEKIKKWLESPGIRDNFQKTFEDCLKEIGTLKNTFIDDRNTLYTFLHMNPNSKFAYTNNENLRNILDSPTFNQQFPKYSGLIQASYRDAKTRKPLLEPAKEAWLELTEITLPDLCIECILSFVSTADLLNMIENDERE